MQFYKTIDGEATSEFTEKHSRFIGYAAHTETEDEALRFIERIKQRHSDAKHNVYAYTIRVNNTTRFSDNGEPHGTAGKPALDILLGMELTDVTVVVTRYFGGILLGTGGLVRAYSKAVKETLEAAQRVLMVPGVLYTARCTYNQYAKLQSVVESFEGSLRDTDFTDSVDLTFSVPSVRSEGFLACVEETFSSSIQVEKEGEIFTAQKILE